MFNNLPVDNSNGTVDNLKTMMSSKQIQKEIDTLKLNLQYKKQHGKN